MKNLFILLIVKFCLAIVINSQQAPSPPKAKSPCTKGTNQKFDDDVAKLFTVGKFGRKFPENRTTLETFCSESRILLERADNYKASCLQGTSKEFSSIIMYSIRKMIKQICGKRNLPSRKKYFEELYKAAKCANRFSDQFGECLNVFIDKMNIAKTKPNGIKKLIPYSCCEYYELLRCFEDIYEKNPQCLADRDFFLNIIRIIFDDIVNVACGEYVESGDKCETLTKLPKIDVSKVRVKSVMKPLVEVWDVTE